MGSNVQFDQDDDDIAHASIAEPLLHYCMNIENIECFAYQDADGTLHINAERVLVSLGVIESIEDRDRIIALAQRHLSFLLRKQKAVVHAR